MVSTDAQCVQKRVCRSCKLHMARPNNIHTTRSTQRNDMRIDRHPGTRRAESRVASGVPWRKIASFLAASCRYKMSSVAWQNTEARQHTRICLRTGLPGHRCCADPATATTAVQLISSTHGKARPTPPWPAARHHVPPPLPQASPAGVHTRPPLSAGEHTAPRRATCSGRAQLRAATSGPRA